MLPPEIKKLIDNFTDLPGIGTKAAERLVFYLLKQPQSSLNIFGNNLINLKKNLKICQICCKYSNTSPCEICADEKRDHRQLCVVTETKDIELIEKTGEYRGLYQVLGGTLNPLENIRPEELNFEVLKNRLRPPLQEIIIALNSDIEGESTMLYLSKLLKPANLKITRLAQGLPRGAELEYTDPSTLSKALKDRTDIK